MAEDNKAEEILDQAKAALDADGDGNLDADDATEAFNKVKEGAKDVADKAKAALDTDGDGHLDTEDLKANLDKAGETLKATGEKIADAVSGLFHKDNK